MSKKAFKVEASEKVPKSWNTNSWEEKAQENPLYAVMTTPDLLDANPTEFSEEHLQPFFAKGERVFRKHIHPWIEKIGRPHDEMVIVEYGCGVGRILRALINEGYRVAGIDISPTMLNHCRHLVPGVETLSALDEHGRSEIDDQIADLVFSFAVVKHIPTLSAFRAAINEMGRILKPGGILLLNANSGDFESGSLENPERTENFETYSLHYRPGEKKPYRNREYSTWSGVYIGIDLLREMLAAHGIGISRIYHHTLKKPQGIWVIGQKA